MYETGGLVALFWWWVPMMHSVCGLQPIVIDFD